MVETERIKQRNKQIIKIENEDKKRERNKR